MKSYDISNLIVRKYNDEGLVLVLNAPKEMVEQMLIDFTFFVDYKHRRMKANIHSYDNDRLILKDYNHNLNIKKIKHY